MNLLLQLVGCVCLGAFLFVVWPPLVLAVAGVALLVGPELAARR